MPPYISKIETEPSVSKMETMSKIKTLHSVQTQRLCNWLVNQRKSVGLTIRGLAGKLDWPPSILGKIETGDRRLDVVEYLEICEVLGVEPGDGLEFVTSDKTKSRRKL